MPAGGDPCADSETEWAPPHLGMTRPEGGAVQVGITWTNCALLPR